MLPMTLSACTFAKWGAIPLLSRDQELALAERLELKPPSFSPCRDDELPHVVGHRGNLRAASAPVSLALDPTIDVVTTLGLSRELHPPTDATQSPDAAQVDRRGRCGLPYPACRLVGQPQPDAPRPVASSAQGGAARRGTVVAASTCLIAGPRSVHPVAADGSILEHQKDAGDRLLSLTRERRTKAVKQLRMN